MENKFRHPHTAPENYYMKHLTFGRFVAWAQNSQCSSSILLNPLVCPDGQEALGLWVSEAHQWFFQLVPGKWGMTAL